MKPIPVILFCFLLSACATTPQNIYTPNITVFYPDNTPQEDQQRFTNTLSASPCISTPVTLIITQYNNPSISQRALGLPNSTVSITGYITINNKNIKIKSKLSNTGVPQSVFFAGVPGLISSTANLYRDIQSVEEDFSQRLWRHVCKSQKILD